VTRVRSERRASPEGMRQASTVGREMEAVPIVVSSTDTINRCAGKAGGCTNGMTFIVSTNSIASRPNGSSPSNRADSTS